MGVSRGARFDDFTRMLGAGLTRRRALQLGAASVAATAAQAFIGVRPALAACPQGTVTCGNFCCVPGPPFLDAFCCEPPGCNPSQCVCAAAESLCLGPNPDAPPATIAICCNLPSVGLGGTDVCLSTAAGPVCCPAAQVCGSACCPVGDTCVAGSCCATAQACAGVCCPVGETCVAGACCANAQVCGAACCPPGETCLGGTTCCPDARVCGTTCCGPGQTCNTYPLGTFTCV